MMRNSFIFLILFLIGCSQHGSKKENRLTKEMRTFMIPGTYDVKVIDPSKSNNSIEQIKAQLSLTNNLGLIEFKGSNSFNDLDSIGISLHDSTVWRQFSINHFLDTITVPAGKSGFDEGYFGYAFGQNDTGGGIADSPDFRQFFKDFKQFLNKEDISGQQSLFIIGRTKKNNHIVIKRLERVVASGRILLNIDKIYILTSNVFSQHLHWQ